MRCRSVVMQINILDLAKSWPGHALLPTPNGITLNTENRNVLTKVDLQLHY